MTTFSPSRGEPIVLPHSQEAQVLGYFALAMALTLLGTWLGIRFAAVLFSSGILLLFLLAELAIVFTSRFWAQHSPLNLILFGIFPLLSGITITPYILSVVDTYVNGASILVNAIASTVFMAAAAAFFARTTRWNLAVLGRALLFALLGLLFMGLLQIFFPSLQGGSTEVFLSGAGVVIFALFTAYDVQRVQVLARTGANPFQLALSLYLDLFNLFLYVLRFMVAISGNRRRSW
jgi:FtsH-binding integral membrane protein